jgi:hypothetical protein
MMKMAIFDRCSESLVNTDPLSSGHVVVITYPPYHLEVTGGVRHLGNVIKFRKQKKQQSTSADISRTAGWLLFAV